jgi:two-component system sensor histidine kinase YesM
MMRVSIIQGFRNLKFRQKLILSYLIIVIIPITVLGIYSYDQSNKHLQKQAALGLTDSANTLVEGIQSKIERINVLTNMVLYNSNIQKILENNYDDLFNLSEDLRLLLEPYLKMLVILNKDIKELTIYTDGQMPEFGTYIMKTSRVAESTWYKDLRNGNGKSNSTWYHDKGDLYVVNQFPAAYVNGHFAALFISLDFDKLFKDLSMSGTDNIGLIISDQNGNIVFSRKTNDSIEPDQVIKAGEMGEITFATPATEYVVIHKLVPGANWMLHYYTPIRGTVVNAGTILSATAVIVIICTVILLILIWLFTNTMIKPINHLYGKMRMVAAGNLDIEVSSRSSDEIGLLTLQFAAMLQRINELIKEVYENRIIQKEAELRALQTQINPHFLYNSLSMINWKALHIDSDEISFLVTTLSKYYRTALNRGETTTSVFREIQNMKAYLDIQLVMHNDKFDIFYDIDEHIHDCEMVNFILQPIVENAIEHGIDRKRSGRGCLAITGIRDMDKLHFTVEDNGPGMSEETMRQCLYEGGAGYGLKNVNERIKLYFGSEYGLSIRSVGTGGVIVTIIFPCKPYKGIT